MVGVMTPVVEPGRDAALFEQGVKLAGRGCQFVFPSALTYADDDGEITGTVTVDLSKYREGITPTRGSLIFYLFPQG